MRHSFLFRLLSIILLSASLPQVGFTQKHWCKILDEKAIPIEQLPKNIATSDGELSLWADYSNTFKESITVYLINQTGEVIGVPTQDGNPYLKLEGQRPNDLWVRAEPHIYSWCGNSYFNSPEIPPDHFLRINGWYPSTGTETQVRYTIFNTLGLTSNTGRGRIQPESVQDAKYDAMAIRYGDLDLIRTVIFEKKDTGNQWPYLTNSAIRRLDDFPPEQTIPIIEAVLNDGRYGERAIDDTIRTYAKHAPDKASRYLMKQLITSDTDIQKRILSMHDKLLIKEEGYLPFLEDHYSAPESTLRFDAMRALIRLQGEAAKMPLLGILRSTEDERTRRYIQMLWEQKFGKHYDISLKADPLGSYDGNSTNMPIPVEITLTNKSNQEQTFGYRSPIEIISFWVTTGNAQIPLRSRHSLPTSTEFESPTNTVKLSPGESHKLIVNLNDYFDPTDLAGESITYYVRCRLPGIHNEPFVSSTGYGIRID